jgi:hypothetical protein
MSKRKLHEITNIYPQAKTMKIDDPYKSIRAVLQYSYRKNQRKIEEAERSAIESIQSFYQKESYILRCAYIKNTK